jgi:hypothetical protein
MDARVTEATNTSVIEDFYAAFDRRDGDRMAACYAHDATFSDPVFTDLRDAEPGAMWRMLTSQAKDLSVERLLLGWAPIVRSATRRRARASLDDFIAREDTT